VFLIPLTGITFLAVDTLSGIKIDPEQIKTAVLGLVSQIETRFDFKIFTPENLSFIPKLGTNLVQMLASSSYSLIINIVIVLFVLYFLLYSYEEFETTIREILPFTPENKQTFVHETKSIIQANAVGIPLLAIIQGIFAYVGYMVFGVSNVLLYAVLTACATIIPVVGTAIIWLPLGVIFLFQGNYIGGIGIILFGAIIIGGVDNLARLILQKRLADIHPLITIFGVFLGIPLFGFWGVIFGPLLLSLFMLFFNMYRHDYIPGSIANPHVTSSYTPVVKQKDKADKNNNEEGKPETEEKQQ
jgi:predicted PurR-regulated permease PerM